MDERLRKLLDEAARESEEAPDEDDGAPLPPHVKVYRPNRANSKVLQVRLNPDEFDALERIAEARKLPMSTVARAQLLKLITESADSPVGAELNDEPRLLASSAGLMTGP